MENKFVGAPATIEAKAENAVKAASGKRAAKIGTKAAVKAGTKAAPKAYYPESGDSSSDSGSSNRRSASSSRSSDSSQVSSGRSPRRFGRSPRLWTRTRTSSKNASDSGASSRFSEESSSTTSPSSSHHRRRGGGGGGATPPSPMFPPTPSGRRSPHEPRLRGGVFGSNKKAPAPSPKSSTSPESKYPGVHPVTAKALALADRFFEDERDSDGDAFAAGWVPSLEAGTLAASLKGGLIEEMVVLEAGHGRVGAPARAKVVTGAGKAVVGQHPKIRGIREGLAKSAVAGKAAAKAGGRQQPPPAKTGAPAAPVLTSPRTLSARDSFRDLFGEPPLSPGATSRDPNSLLVDQVIGSVLANNRSWVEEIAPSTPGRGQNDPDPSVFVLGESDPDPDAGASVEDLASELAWVIADADAHFGRSDPPPSPARKLGALLARAVKADAVLDAQDLAARSVHRLRDVFVLNAPKEPEPETPFGSKEQALLQGVLMGGDGGAPSPPPEGQSKNKDAGAGKGGSSSTRSGPSGEGEGEDAGGPFSFFPEKMADKSAKKTKQKDDGRDIYTEPGLLLTSQLKTLVTFSLRDSLRDPGEDSDQLGARFRSLLSVVDKVLARNLADGRSVDLGDAVGLSPAEIPPDPTKAGFFGALVGGLSGGGDDFEGGSSGDGDGGPSPGRNLHATRAVPGKTPNILFCPALFLLAHDLYRLMQEDIVLQTDSLERTSMEIQQDLIRTARVWRTWTVETVLPLYFQAVMPGRGGGGSGAPQLGGLFPHLCWKTFAEVVLDTLLEPSALMPLAFLPKRKKFDRHSKAFLLRKVVRQRKARHGELKPVQTLLARRLSPRLWPRAVFAELRTLGREQAGLSASDAGFKSVSDQCHRVMSSPCCHDGGVGFAESNYHTCRMLDLRSHVGSAESRSRLCAVHVTV